MHCANSEEVNTTLEIMIFDLILQTDREQPPAEHDPSAGLQEEGEEEEAKESDKEFELDPPEPEPETDRPHKKIRSDKVL